MQPLNPLLYRLLQARFGQVRTANQGVPFHGSYRKDGKGNDRLEIIEPGEAYRVNCPKCGDTKFHCYINHTWGSRDDHGRLNLFLLHCFRDTCDGWEGYESRRDFFDSVQTYGSVGDLTKAPITEGVVASNRKQVFAWPGESVPLTDLEDDHPANSYLSERGYDPARLSRFYKIRYCLSSSYRLARGRIIIPVFDGGELRGWQARHVGDQDWKSKSAPPKYFTVPGMQRSFLVYNLDNAKKYRTLVICEGPSDVWSFGPMAVCIFGSSITATQASRVEAAFSDHSVVLLLDPGAMESNRTAHQVDRWKDGVFDGGFASVVLPDGKDPGDLDRAFLRTFVREEAEKQGVELSYEKR